MFSIGIIGLPNVGKSTLFKALTKISVPIANYPFTTIGPHHGVVPVKDERLKKINEKLNLRKKTLPMIEFIDIAGLIKGAHKGEGLGNKFLSHIGEANILLEIIKNFSICCPKKNTNENNQYQLWEEPNPLNDIETIKEEILKRDQEVLKSAIEKKETEEKESLEILLNIIEEKIWLFDFFEKISTEKREKLADVAKKTGLISTKPIIYLFNTIEKKENQIEKKFPNSLFLNIKLEEEICDLTKEEKKELGEKSRLDDVISSCYNKLDLITFYTIKGGKETRATEIKKNTPVIEAAGKIHTDFKENFIFSEVLKFEDFINLESWSQAREKGLLKKAGKNYIVQDGDIIEFKI